MSHAEDTETAEDADSEESHRERITRLWSHLGIVDVEEIDRAEWRVTSAVLAEMGIVQLLKAVDAVERIDEVVDRLDVTVGMVIAQARADALEGALVDAAALVGRLRACKKCGVQLAIFRKDKVHIAVEVDSGRRHNRCS
jgi:hypothetical protein